MALDAGDNSVEADTMAKAIFDAMKSELDGFTPDPEDTDATYARIAAAIASGVVSHIVAEADVRITTSDSGLQRDNTGGNPATLAPSSDVVLTGAVE